MKKILYLTRLNPYDLKAWSGTNYFIFKILKKNFNVISVGPLSNRIRYLFLFKKFFYSIFKVKFDIDRPILVAKDFAKQIEKKINNIYYDAVVTSDTYLVSFLKTRKPIFIFTDMDFATYYNHYFSNSKISKKTLLEGNFCENLSLKKSKKIILTSDWAIRSCSSFYKIEKKKFIKLPFGANILKLPITKNILKNIRTKSQKVCNLISVGVHWERKGMDKAAELVAMMNKKGLSSKLFIVGAKVPHNYSTPKNVIILNFLDKNKDMEEFNKLLNKMHFHVLFSKAEGFGVVNSEASAFGLYTVTHNIGGISGAIADNINGFKFSINGNVEVISNHLINIFKNHKKFLKKSYSSREYYEKKLHWNIIGEKLKKIINKNS
jgi:glycosyltransferase involved in cell wall biosynthesis